MASENHARTATHSQYYDSLVPRHMHDSLIPTCFGNATLETLKVTSPYPTLGDSIAKYTKQRTGVSDSNSKLRGSKTKLNR